MSTRGYFGIGCYGMKTKDNYGTLFRSASILGASFVFLIGHRFKKQSMDTVKSWKHVPTFSYASFDEFKQHLPYDCSLIGVELCDEARPLGGYIHPERACYLLGAEDTGLPNKILDSCNEVVVLPGEISLNVSVAGSIVLYDRFAKSDRKDNGKD